jgi:hypothetical protein
MALAADLLDESEVQLKWEVKEIADARKSYLLRRIVIVGDSAAVRSVHGYGYIVRYLDWPGSGQWHASRRTPS